MDFEVTNWVFPFVKCHRDEKENMSVYVATVKKNHLSIGEAYSSRYRMDRLVYCGVLHLSSSTCVLVPFWLKDCTSAPFMTFMKHTTLVAMALVPRTWGSRMKCVGGQVLLIVPQKGRERVSRYVQSPPGPGRGRPECSCGIKKEMKKERVPFAFLFLPGSELSTQVKHQLTFIPMQWTDRSLSLDSLHWICHVWDIQGLLASLPLCCVIKQMYGNLHCVLCTVHCISGTPAKRRREGKKRDWIAARVTRRVRM